MDDRTVAYWSSALFLWPVFAWNTWRLIRRPRDIALRCVCVVVFCCAAIMTVSAPESIGFVNRATGVPNIAALLSFSLVVSLGAAARILVVLWQGGQASQSATVRRWVLGFALVIAAMTVLFAAGSAPVERRTDFEAYYARTPFIAEFVLLYLIALALALVRVIQLCWSWARIVGRPWLRRGLRLVAIGCVFGLGVSLSRGAAMAARWTGHSWEVLNTVVSAVCAVCGLTLGALGLVLPAMAARAARLGAGIRHFRDCRRLLPLWRALSQAVPAVVLPTPLPWWDQELRLARRLAEINDGQLALGTRWDCAVAERARGLGRRAGLSGLELEAAVEAARLRSAVAGRLEGIGAEPDGAGPAGAADRSELVWLNAVAKAFDRSPVVAAAVAAEVPGTG